MGTTLPWFAFNIDDYLGDTMTLDTEGHGAYLLLILHYYRTGKALPDRDSALANIAKMPLANWLARRDDIAPFFKVEAGQWVHNRIERELLAACSKHAARSEHARKAAMAKHANPSSEHAPSKPAASQQQKPRPKPARSMPPASIEHASSMPESCPSPTQEHLQEQTTTPSSRSSSPAAQNDDPTTAALKVLVEEKTPAPNPEPSWGDKTESWLRRQIGDKPPAATPPPADNPLGTQLPETWVPDAADIVVAKTYGMDDSELEAEVLKFHALNAQNGTFSKNWKATWQLFCARFKERRDRQPKLIPARVEVDTKPHQPSGKDYERALIRWCSSQSGWPRQSLGAEPGQPGCKASYAMMKRLGIDPVSGIYRKPQVEAS